MGKIKKIKPPKLSKETEKDVDDEAPKLVKITTPSKATNLRETKSKFPTESSDKISFEKPPTLKKIISKKYKRKQKHQNFQSKIELIKKQSENQSLVKKKNKKTSSLKPKQQKSNLSRNLKALKDALPSLDELLQFKTKPTDIKTGIAEYDIPKAKKEFKKGKKRTKQREILERMKRFNDLLKDPDYQKDARETIANHIKFSRDLSDN